MTNNFTINLTDDISTIYDDVQDARKELIKEAVATEWKSAAEIAEETGLTLRTVTSLIHSRCCLDTNVRDVCKRYENPDDPDDFIMVRENVTIYRQYRHK